MPEPRPFSDEELALGETWMRARECRRATERDIQDAESTVRAMQSVLADHREHEEACYVAFRAQVPEGVLDRIGGEVVA